MFPLSTQTLTRSLAQGEGGLTGNEGGGWTCARCGTRPVLKWGRSGVSLLSSGPDIENAMLCALRRCAPILLLSFSELSFRLGAFVLKPQHRETERAVRETLPRWNAVTLDTSCFVVSKSFPRDSQSCTTAQLVFFRWVSIRLPSRVERIWIGQQTLALPCTRSVSPQCERNLSSPA